MDTWWKRLMYSKWLKASAVVGFCVVGILLVMGVVGFRLVPIEDDVYKTDYYKQSLVDAAGYVRDWIVRYEDENIFKTASKRNINEYKQAQGEELTDEEALKRILADRKEYYITMQNVLVKGNANVDFYGINTKDGSVVTNMKGQANQESIIKELTSRKLYIVGNGHYITEQSEMMADENNRYSMFTSGSYYEGDTFEEEENYKIYVALKDNIYPGDSYYDYIVDFYAKKDLEQPANICLAIAMILGVFLGVYWIAVVGRTKHSKEIALNAFDGIPLEIQFVGWFIAMFVAGGVADGSGLWENILNWYPYLETDTNRLEIIVHMGINFTLICFLVVINLLIVSSFIKHIKNKSLDKYVGTVRLIKGLMQKLSTERNIVIGVMALVGINGGMTLGCLFLAVVSGSIVLFILALIAANVMFALLIYKLASDYKILLDGTNMIAKGNLEAKIELNKSIALFEDMANSINTIGTGLEKAVEQSVKSERLKAELITNVSHDLKTPLTSIISYIDLLKQETIDNDNAKEYINVLDERSNRLKHLVEDLVEASKAVTGNVEAKLEPLMLDELVLQALGEYMDRMEAQGIEVINTKVEPVKVLADGRHMWRIVENLLSNISKYGMPHTRAYVEVTSREGWGCLVVKNISKDPLNIAPSELTERFVRGDASRTTEGSGLGLAIAESLIRLQGGTMKISIDGDLFKVELEIPLANNKINFEKR